MGAAAPLPDESRSVVRRIEAGRLGLSVRIWGDRDKPVVLLQHGGKDHGRSWDWTVNALIDDHCVVVPDLRGHGDSDRPTGWGYDTVDFVSDLAFVVEELVASGLEAPFDIVGHSLGGNVALHYTAAQPERVRRVVSIEGLGYSQKSYDDIVAKPPAERLRAGVERRLKVAHRAPRQFESREDAVRRMAALHKKLSDEQARHLTYHALGGEEGAWHWKHDPLLAFSSIRPVPPAEYGDLYASITQPVLLMYGKESWASSPREDGRVSFFQDAELIEYEGAGHWLHHDCFPTFMSDLKRFLGAER